MKVLFILACLIGATLAQWQEAECTGERGVGGILFKPGSGASSSGSSGGASTTAAPGGSSGASTASGAGSSAANSGATSAASGASSGATTAGSSGASTTTHATTKAAGRRRREASSASYSSYIVQVFCESTSGEGVKTGGSGGAKNGQAKKSFSLKEGNKVDDSATNCDVDSFVVGAKAQAQGDDLQITLSCAKREGLKNTKECDTVNGELKAPPNPSQVQGFPGAKGCSARLVVAVGVEGQQVQLKICKFEKNNAKETSECEQKAQTYVEKHSSSSSNSSSSQNSSSTETSERSNNSSSSNSTAEEENSFSSNSSSKSEKSGGKKKCVCLCNTVCNDASEGGSEGGSSPAPGGSTAAPGGSSPKPTTAAPHRMMKRSGGKGKGKGKKSGSGGKSGKGKKSGSGGKSGKEHSKKSKSESHSFSSSSSYSSYSEYRSSFSSYESYSFFKSTTLRCKESKVEGKKAFVVDNADDIPPCPEDQCNCPCACKNGVAEKAGSHGGDQAETGASSGGQNKEKSNNGKHLGQQKNGK